MKKQFLAASLLTLIMTPGYSQDINLDNLMHTNYKLNLHGRVQLCAMTTSTGVDSGEKCRAEGKVAIKGLYDSRAMEVTKSAAKDALKMHFVKVLAALAGTERVIGESRIGYDQRQAKLFDNMNEAWSLYEVER